MKTQVCIIGGGPSGLMLSQLLHLKGIDTIVLEKHSREYVLGRIRAGVLEHGFAELMREAQCGERMDREGEIHDGFEISDNGALTRVDLHKCRCVVTARQRQGVGGRQGGSQYRHDDDELQSAAHSVQQTLDAQRAARSILHMLRLFVHAFDQKLIFAPTRNRFRVMS